MKVVTPGQTARHTGSKYLGVLVAAKFARQLNELRRGELVEDPTLTGGEPQEKLTTTALEEVRRLAAGQEPATGGAHRRVGERDVVGDPVRIGDPGEEVDPVGGHRRSW